MMQERPSSSLARKVKQHIELHSCKNSDLIYCLNCILQIENYEQLIGVTYISYICIYNRRFLT